METSSKQLRIGLAGLGNVGSGVYKNLLLNREILQERTGAHLKVARIAVRDPGRERDVKVSPEMLTTEWRELIDDPQIDVIVELIGGDDEAFH